MKKKKTNSWGDEHYTARAKAEHLRARSYFKLEEIDQKNSLIHTGQTLLELGTAPGAWSLYVLKKTKEKALLFAVDLQPIEPIPSPAYKFQIADAFKLKPEHFQNSLPEPTRFSGFDGILSDMAPKTSGIRSADSAASAELALCSLEIACKLLKPGGFLIAKYLQGGEEQEIAARFRSEFGKVKTIKPKASRKNSAEIFFIGTERIKTKGDDQKPDKG